ncbi:hypothetical protein RRG08_010051 [Elysia crispata]|uniref:HTH CENPB-type domain-containing protein n=1 Tax=Elysia crispata TaxID=231223 RepID=A0AAE1B9V2_9GAST|nr:hypothetical protein RRG08_010051 [Elysia crispata]
MHTALTGSTLGEGHQVSRPILVEKAKDFAERVGVTGFTESTGWLDRLKSHHGIIMKRICRESAAVRRETTETCKDTVLRTMLEEFSPDDIFNVDETGLPPNTTSMLQSCD